MSGCDATSAFFGKGKLQIIQLFNRSQHLHDIPTVFNDPASTREVIEQASEKFIHAVYTKIWQTAGSDNLNDRRFQ